MDRQILNITANEQILTVDEPIRISTNKVNYIEAHFTLGDNWSGYDSVRAVWFNDFYCISTVLDSNGVAFVPSEVMKRNGKVKVNLVGSISENDVLTDRLTSYPVVAVIVDCTAQITGANTSPITPSEYEQFVAAVHEDAERAEAGASASEQSATESANSASASAESAQEAEAHASSAQIYAGMASNEAEASANSASEAQTYAQSASESATDAEGYAEDAESARDTILGMRATANTLSEGSDATASYSNGLLTLGIPRGNTGAKGDKGDRGDVGATPNLSIGTVTTLEPTESATATISGTAENPILSFGIPKGDTGEVSLQELDSATVVQTLSDTEPYNYRRTNNGNGSGHREYDEIVGASVGWNQLSTPNDSAETTYGVTVTPNADGTVTVNGTSNDSGVLSSYKNVSVISGHKYFMCLSKSVGGLSIYTSIGGSISGTSLIRNCGSTGSVVVRLRTGNGKTYNNVVIGVNTIDLTLFNSQIADYVYSLEQSTAGSGVTWLKSHFPKLFDNGYMSYDSGSIKSVSGLTAHEMVGKNLWDEEWEVGGIRTADGTTTSSNAVRSKNFSKIIGNTSYYVKAPNDVYVFFYGADYGYITYTALHNGAFTSPQKASYFKIQITSAYGTTYNHDICINLSDTSINGQYFPHEKHTYPLDSSVTLRGKYVLDNGQLKAVGDVWHPNDGIDRNYAEVDLGTLNSWTRFETISGHWRFRATLAEAGGNSVNQVANMICTKYSAITGNESYAGMKVGITGFDTGGYIFVYDETYETAEDFRTAMSGVMLVYEKQTASTEITTPFTSPQWCDPHGTEEYVGSELPVGHNTDYPMSLSDTVPTANGNYTLKCTVTNGKPTFTWQSV